MLQAPLSSQEIYLIDQLLNSDINITPIRIAQTIYEQLGINRSPQSIKIFLTKRNQLYLPILGNKNQREQEFNGTNLFKTFSDSNMQFHPTFAKPTRIRNNFSFISKRKAPKQQFSESRSSWTLQQRLDQIERINQQCTYTYDKYDRKSSRKTSFKQQSGVNINILWFYNQFFYSNYDRKYFQNSQIKEIYTQLNFKPQQINLRTHKLILQALPKPKLFNDQFLTTEKGNLEQFRNICRQNTKNLSKSNQSTTQFPVHSIVLALHPSCGHLHTGSIMAYYKQNLYMVRFLKPELPAHKILDINMSTQFTSLSNKMQNKNDLGDRNQSMSNQNTQGEIIENINFQMTGFLIKMLAFKADIVKLARSLIDKVDKKQNVAPQEETQSNIKNAFQWVTIVVRKLDIIIEQALLRFRLRGVNQANSSTVFSNLKSLLINPLKLMSKQFENSSEQLDINAAQQIKKIINKQRQNQIKKAINNAIVFSNETENSENKANKKQTQNKMMPLLYTCLGILADLKNEGKDFDLQNNQYLMKLAEISGKQNSQTFNQVYQRLYSIVTKVKQ